MTDIARHCTHDIALSLSAKRANSFATGEDVRLMHPAQAIVGAVKGKAEQIAELMK
ncbi:hypothetical protein J2W40_001138 [Sphingobium xenophagum]|uniref:Uncharacterized protein n=1 Tax=Sphingobium xenophagum TaxID=121428 RepID=A0ABU1WYD0_SPHXE|nr:hypothetical protein [Sphingobium xenophagum]MDR7154326.1 hypothetical protein [Sphingobium xenophagum]